MVYDMLSYVVLSTLISESGEREDGKKTYQQLMRKLKASTLSGYLSSGHLLPNCHCSV